MLAPFTAADVPDQTGKTHFVTGANTGLGLETSKVLAARGARVLMGCRSRSKAEAARDEILALTPEADLVLVDLDLGDLASVRAAAEVVSAEPRLDVLVNNAGIMMPPQRGETVDGFEAQIGVNHLGPFALTGLLLPKLLQTSEARIVNTSSNAHKGGRMDFDDLMAKRSYSPLGQYNMSKLANLLHTFELDRRLRARGADAIAVCVHPGGAATDLFSRGNFPGFMVKALMPVATVVINSAAQGAWPTLAGATAPGIEGGAYFGPRGPLELKGKAVQVKPTKRARDLESAERLWQVSCELTGVVPPI